jgi:membrane fusion protein, multidrug efflux system
MTSNKLNLMLLFALPAVALLLMSCGKTATPQAGADPNNRRLNVKVETVQPAIFSETLQIAGIVKAYDDVMISSEEGGVIKEWMVEKGQRVKKGEVIAALKDDVLRPSYLAAESQAKLAELNYQKQEKVYQDQGISELQVKTAEFSRDGVRAQAELAKARWERTFIKSPVGGILDDHLVDAGEMTIPGVALARVVAIDRVRIQINVPERYLGSLTKGTPVTFSVIAYPGEQFSGRIAFVGSTVSPDNRTVMVECVIANPGGKLKPDMIAKSTIVQSVPRKALLVAEEIVQQVDEGKQVVYIAENGRAVQRSVSLGARADGKVEIVSGLKAGEQVIITGQDQLVDGQALSIAN